MEPVVLLIIVITVIDLKYTQTLLILQYYYINKVKGVCTVVVVVVSCRILYCTSSSTDRFRVTRK